MRSFYKAMLITMLIAMPVGGGLAAIFYFDFFGLNEPAVVEVFAEDFAEDFSEVYSEASANVSANVFANSPPEESYIQYYFPGYEPLPAPHENLQETTELGCPYTVTILLSAAGDTTLGGDRRWHGYHAFMREFEQSGRDHSIFLSNIAHIFYESDLSIVNLEGALTYAYYHMDKEFVFRGPPHFAQILAAGYVDAVTLANNHTRDFFLRGYNDTRAALDYAGVIYFGNEFNRIIEVNGIQVGLFGHRIWADHRENRERITRAINYLRESGAQLIIAYFHWGVERETIPEQYQINIGRFTISQGADLVLGAHPHVIQGIENYNGRYIVYSLANFSFGGNAGPADQDSIIFQQKFTFYRGVLLPENDINIIPIRVSSVRTHNDFRPTPAYGADAERIMARVGRYSAALG